MSHIIGVRRKQIRKKGYAKQKVWETLTCVVIVKINRLCYFVIYLDALEFFDAKYQNAFSRKGDKVIE